jgi:hypothetical protein
VSRIAESLRGDLDRARAVDALYPGAIVRLSNGRPERDVRIAPLSFSAKLEGQTVRVTMTRPEPMRGRWACAYCGGLNTNEDTNCAGCGAGRV